MVVIEENGVDDNLHIQLRNKFIEELDQSADDLYEPEDVERIRNDDDYCKRFILHKKGNFDEAYSMLKEALAWRKSFGVKTCTEDTIPAEFFEARAAFPYNTDKHGNPIILLLVRFHKKNSEYVKDMRRFVIYWVEKMEADFNGSQMTVIMSCTGAGLSNLDLDLIKFLITLFRSYYPHSLAHILIYEMPWIFNAAWKIIKAWLPEDFVEKIVFVNKTSILDFVDIENLHAEMGGTSTLVYVPPKFTTDENSNSVAETFQEADVKRVHFSHSGHTRIQDSFADTSELLPGRKSSPNRSHLLMTDDYCILAGILKISPSQELKFFPAANKNENSEVTIKLTCVSDKRITYKVKTNNIDNYRVKPSTGIIEPNDSIDISVYLIQGHRPQLSDKFLIMVMPLPETSSSATSLGQLWKNASPDLIADHKLKCVVGIPQSEKDMNKLDKSLQDITSTLANLKAEVQQLQSNQVAMLRNQKLSLYVLFVLGISLCSHLVITHSSSLIEAFYSKIFD